MFKIINLWTKSFKTLFQSLFSTQIAVLSFLSMIVIGQTMIITKLHQKHLKDKLIHDEEVKKLHKLRQVERKGRVTSQQKSRDVIQSISIENGYKYLPIGHIESPFPDRRGTPRQPLLVTAAKGKIRFNKKLIQLDHYKELNEFSHIWVIFVFHCNTNIDSLSYSSSMSQSNNQINQKSHTLQAKVKPPRLKGMKVGCLTTRTPHRPNNIGLSLCKIVSIGNDYIEICGIDMVHGTPVLDSKFTI